jgi:hypothetical protein
MGRCIHLLRMADWRPQVMCYGVRKRCEFPVRRLECCGQLQQFRIQERLGKALNRREGQLLSSLGRESAPR